MKKLLIITALAITLTSFRYDNFCDGFELGWQNGYCFEMEMMCIPPIPPICPLPLYYEDNTFQGGYNRGFAMGLSERD